MGWMGCTRSAIGVGWAAHAHQFAHNNEVLHTLNFFALSASMKWWSVDICGYMQA